MGDGWVTDINQYNSYQYLFTLCVNYNKIHYCVGRYVYGYLLDSKISEGIVFRENHLLC